MTSAGRAGGLRRRGFRAIAWFGVGALLAVLLAGCGRRQELDAGRDRFPWDSTAVASPARVDSALADLPPPPPPDPPGPPVGGSDPVLNAARAKLAPWEAMWRKADPRFRLDALHRLDTGEAFRGGHVEPMADVHAEPRGVSSVLSAWSPDRRYEVVFNWYRVVEDSHDGIETIGEPNSSPLLLDHRLGTSNQFELLGTPDGYDWGTWLSATSFALAGWQDADDSSQWAKGRIRIYSLPDSTVTTYVTPVVAIDEHGAYWAAWKAWVDERLEETRPRRKRR